LGRALLRLLAGFRARVRVYDPWLPLAAFRALGAEQAGLNEVLSISDTIFVTASVTSENPGFPGADAFVRMRRGAAFVRLSRAAVVDFEALTAAVAQGRIKAASDVYPEKPLPLDPLVRGLKGFLHSAHRAGALDQVFLRMGEMVLEDIALIEKGLRRKPANAPSARRRRACARRRCGCGCG
jgi:phosphoglycerate dehydrogenase-like enzyme